VIEKLIVFKWRDAVARAEAVYRQKSFSIDNQSRATVAVMFQSVFFPFISVIPAATTLHVTDAKVATVISPGAFDNAPGLAKSHYA
jgi:hypothetical protein